MPPKTKSLIWAGVFLLVVHFSMTIMYTVPGVPAPGFIKSLAPSYMTPMFHQGWMLFAPDVKTYNTEMVYRAPENGQWSRWIKSDELRSKHDHRRIPYLVDKMGLKLLNTMQGSDFGLYYYEGQPMYDKVELSADYKRAVYYAYTHYQHLEGAKADSIQLRLTCTYSPDMKTGEIKDDLIYDFPTFYVHGE